MAAGGRPLLVGGCVRDALLTRLTGFPRDGFPKDVDVEVFGASGDDVVAALRRVGRVDEVGRAFSVIKVVVRGEDFDVSAAGEPGSAAESDEVAAFGRRDFTMNAMGWDPATDELVDPYGGSADLVDRVLQHTSAAFADDPLRVLRGVQFAGRFEMDFAPETALLCRELAPAGAELPAERVWGEFAKIATRCPSPSRSLRALHHSGWEELFPELVAVRDVPQDPTWHPEGPVHVHLGLAADAAATAATAAGLSEEDRIVVVLGALLHDLGKATHTVVPDATSGGTGRITSHGHAEAGVAPTRSFLRRVGAPGHIVTKIVPLVREHMAVVSTGPEGPTRSAVRRLIRRLDAPDGQGPGLVLWAAVVAADHAGRGPASGPSPAAAWLRVARDLGDIERPRQCLVTGAHLIEAGLRPGPAFRPILADAEDAQDDGEFDDEVGAQVWLARRLAEERLAWTRGDAPATGTGPGPPGPGERVNCVDENA